ncbi:MAG: hypothetical protein RBU28_10690 [Bacteroidales bacterium]|nr:hypothetical protein [Bacteroidales bacterium]
MHPDDDGTVGGWQGLERMAGPGGQRGAGLQGRTIPPSGIREIS